MAKYIVKILNTHTHRTLNNHYNIVNSTNLAIALTNLKINKKHKLVTCDIKDLYINIPTEETLAITKSMLLKNTGTQITQHIITLMRLVLSQNYFKFQNKIHQPEKGVSLGSPVSSTIAELFLQHFEDIRIKQLLDTKNIICYTRYVEDILIIHDTKRIHPDHINTYINQIHNRHKAHPHIRK